MTVKITVEVIRHGESIKVTEGEAIFVSVDENVRPIPVIGWNGKKPRIRRKATGSSACRQPKGCAGSGDGAKQTPKN
jgi:acyl-CoA hydrolase